MFKTSVNARPHCLLREPDRISAQTLYRQKLESLPEICAADSMCLSLLVFTQLFSEVARSARACEFSRACVLRVFLTSLPVHFVVSLLCFPVYFLLFFSAWLSATDCLERLVFEMTCMPFSSSFRQVGLWKIMRSKCEQSNIEVGLIATAAAIANCANSVEVAPRSSSIDFT